MRHDMKELLTNAAARAVQYLDGIENRRVTPAPEDAVRVEALGGKLPPHPTDPAEVIALLDQAGSPATVASAGGRYFGFVTGGSLAAALAANWLAGAWDQNAAFRVMSPAAAVLEEIGLEWIRDLLGLPPGGGGGFVTGATMANFTCLAAARHALLLRAGWDVEENGLFQAPPIRIVVGEEVHVSLLKALAMLGLGRSRVTRVAADEQGRMKAEALSPLDDRTIVCIQAGNVNTGAFDPAEEICVRARKAAAWVHVDGAFGLWAAASPAYKHLAAGIAAADSWTVDCHKWLNVPYDSGLALVRHPEHLRAAMAFGAAYLPAAEKREPAHYVPESSRRARGIEVWAALRSLGREGLAAMIERNCRLAARFADGLRNASYSVLNEVVLNQLLVSFGEDEITKRVIAEVQNDGVCWCGGTEWHGRAAMRISVSSWKTTEHDVDRSLAAIIRIAHSTTTTRGSAQWSVSR
jgi:glutamate/tyrosine decarboxylase-like PLP-dependent enzyme